MKFLDVVLDSEKEAAKEFLKGFDLSLEDDVTHTINCVEGNKVIATISCSKNIIKCMAIDNNFQGESIANTLISKMIQHIYINNHTNIFVFTKPLNKDIFISMGFTKIIETSNTVMLEMHSDITKTLLKLKSDYKLEKQYASIVVNCNPMTLGHLYLIEKCVKENENVIVFVVEEDKSYFKFSDRFEIVKKECTVFSNVVVVPSTDYMISASTFPTYFLKDEVDVDEESMEIDLKIFKEYFIPIFNITSRYVGTEMFNVLTRNYNEAMKKYLDTVVEIDRREIDGRAVSATYVRDLISKQSWKEIEKIVPKSTYDLIIDKFSN